MMETALPFISGVLQFLKDWIPPIGIFFGGGFAYWKWHSTEQLRRQREMPTADKGSLSLTALPINDYKVWVQIDAIWRNPGNLPFELDVKETVIGVYEIKPSIEAGAVQVKADPGDLGMPLYSVQPYGSARSVKFEPKSESLIQSHFVLDRGKIYLFRWKLYRKAEKKYSRTRFIMFDANTLNTTTPVETGEAEAAEEPQGS